MIKELLRSVLYHFIDLAWMADLLDGTCYLRSRYPQLRPVRIVEVGARFGEDTLLLSAAWPEAHAIAFECNPPALEISQNRLADRPNIELVACALGDVDGSTSFHSVPVTSNAGASSMLRMLPGGGKATAVDEQSIETIHVAVRCLDSWLAEKDYPAPELLWMDVEGAEGRVLAGARCALDRIAVVYTEVSLRTVRTGQTSFREIAAVLSRHGLREQRPWLRLLKKWSGGTTVNVVFMRERAV